MLPKKQTGRANSSKDSAQSKGLDALFSSSSSSQKMSETVQRFTDFDRSYHMLPIRDIVFNEHNKNFNRNDTAETLELFAQTIPTPKDLRNPIRVNRRKDGKLVLVSGERRLKAFIYHRNKELKKNPNRKSTEWDFIKAYVHEGLDEYEEVYELNAENVQNRELTPEQRFIALEDMIAAFDAKAKTDLTKEAKEKIMKLLGVSQRTLQLYLRLHKAAGEFDLFLLKSGKISFSDFKRRTEATIKANRETENKIAAISIEKVVEKHYYDESNNSVYFIDRIYDDLGEQDMFCVYSINEIATIAIHRPNLGNYLDKREAQYALDLFASENRLNEYIGDFSEFRHEHLSEEHHDNETQPAGITLTPDLTNSDNSEIEDEQKVTSLTDTDLSEVPVDTIKEDDFDETNDTVQSEEESTTTSLFTENNTMDSLDEPEATSKASFSTNSSAIIDQISHFEGTNLNGITIQGALFIPVYKSENDKVKNDRLYIISGIEFGKSLGKGKFEGKCLLEEVIKGSVRRIDDYNK